MPPKIRAKNYEWSKPMHAFIFYISFKLMEYLEIDNFIEDNHRLPNHFWSFVLLFCKWCMMMKFNDWFRRFQLDIDLIPNLDTLNKRIENLKRNFLNSINNDFDKNMLNFKNFVFYNQNYSIYHPYQWYNDIIHHYFIDINTANYDTYKDFYKPQLDTYLLNCFRVKYSINDGFLDNPLTDLIKLDTCILNINNFFIIDDSCYMNSIHENSMINYRRIYSLYIIINGFRFEPMTLIMLYVHSQLLILLVEAKFRRKISIYTIIKLILNRFTNTYNFNNIELTIKQIESHINSLQRKLIRHKNIRIGEIIENIMLWFNCTDYNREMSQTIDNIIENVATHSRAFKDYFVRNENLHGRRRLQDDVFQVLKNSINYRKYNKLFHLEYRLG